MANQGLVGPILRCRRKKTQGVGIKDGACSCTAQAVKVVVDVFLLRS